MGNKWMTKLCDAVGKAAADMPAPNESLIRMPSPSLNWALDNGGLTAGKIICFYGPESGGKSLLAQLTLIEVQKMDPEAICVLFDAEYSFNKIWFQKLGGDLDRLIVRQTNKPIEIFDYIYGEMYKLLQDGCPIRAVAIDSIKSIKYPKDIKENSMKQTMGGGGASYLGSVFKSVIPVVREFGLFTILVQQVYDEMDEHKKLANPYKVPDGFALKHACDYMCEVTRVDKKDEKIFSDKQTIHGDNLQVGHKVRIKIKKNRVGAPYRIAEFSLEYSKGIVAIPDEIFDLAKSLKVLYHPIGDNGKVNAQMWTYSGGAIIRGADNMLATIRSSNVIQDQLVKLCEAVKDDDTLAARNLEKDTGVVIDLSDQEIDEVI